MMEKRERKSPIQSTHVNTQGNKNCLDECGLGMKFDAKLKQCMLGIVGKNVNDMSTSPKNISIYMGEDTLRTYLNSAGKRVEILRKIYFIFKPLLFMNSCGILQFVKVE